MLIVQKIEDKLLATCIEETGIEFRRDISSLLVLGDDLTRFISPIIDDLRLKRSSTIKSCLGQLKSLGSAITAIGIASLPNDEAHWQKFVTDVHHFVITRKDSAASLATRISANWLTIRGFFVILIEAGIIPVSIYLPPVRDSFRNLDTSAYKDLLVGQRPPIKVKTSRQLDKLIVPVSLSRTDSQYLEEIRDALAHRRNILFEILKKHWQQIKENIEFGRDLRNHVDWEQLRPLVEKYPPSTSKDHPAHPSTGICGLARYLAVIVHKYDGCPPSDDDLRNLKRQFECLPKFSSIKPLSSLRERYFIPEAPYNRPCWSQRNVLWWWLGRLSHFDVSVLSALLIMLHPTWTPASILLSRICDRNGKKYLNLSADAPGYEVEKSRAKAMKAESLDPLAYEIISTLITENDDLRKELCRAGDPKWSLLFLPYGRNKIVSAPIPSGASAYLSGSIGARSKSNQMWLGMVYPELVAAGLSEGTMSFAKIRNTEGVLEWFRTKSLRAVAKKLGNTEKVVLEHYIPKPIIDAWNTRSIRRFQNLWISIAAAKEDFLLEITDFVSLADLHTFIKGLLKLHAPTDSTLAEMLHFKFKDISTDLENSASSQASRHGHLHISISKESLLTLYSYQAAILQCGLPEQALDKPDEATGLSPRNFLALADLLQSQLPKDRNPEYVACHEYASCSVHELNNINEWKKLLLAT